MVDEPSSEAPQPEDNSAQVVIDLENLIKTHITGIEKRRSDLKTQREMLASALGNDAAYKEAEQKAKEAAKAKSALKFEIMKQPANAALGEKVKELAAEIKEMDAALSEYLREYQRMTGVNEIEGEDGEVREIVYVAKLVKKQKNPR
jgi:hypothetical protein